MADIELPQEVTQWELNQFDRLPSFGDHWVLLLVYPSRKSRNRARNWRKKRNSDEKLKDKREKLHEQQELFLVQGVNAAIALGEATARAVQPDPGRPLQR